MICSHCYQILNVFALSCAHCERDPLLDGRYRLEEQVGQGASARTYRATCLKDNQTVAVKELLFHRIDVLKTHELFEREARVLRQLRHPQIPKFIETFQVEDGRSLCIYLVQEFIEGRTIAEAFVESRFSERDALQFLIEVAAPLEYLHTLPTPVVHRDLKPANLMRRSSNQQVVLIDFGTVRDVLKPQGEGNTVAGTFGYMSPEQLYGDATPASDIFALGATTVALLSNREFLSSDQMFQYMGQLQISPELRKLLTAMLGVEPQKRPDIAEVRQTAQELLAGKLAVVPAHKRRSYLPLLVVLLLAGLVFVLGTAGLVAYLLVHVESEHVIAEQSADQSVISGSNSGFEEDPIKTVEAIVEAGGQTHQTNNPPSIPQEDPRFTPSPGPKTTAVPDRTLGLYTLGMTVDEAREASKNLLRYDREYSALIRYNDRGANNPPYIGRMFMAPNVLDGHHANCELGFVAENRLSEINCGLTVSNQPGSEFQAFERSQVQQFKESFGGGFKKVNENGYGGRYAYYVWKGAGRKLTLHFAPEIGLKAFVARQAGGGRSNVVFNLVSTEHEKIIDDVMESKNRAFEAGEEAKRREILERKRRELELLQR